MSEQIDDLFGDVAQAARAPVEQRKPLTAEDVREQMLGLIEQLREADAVPFEPAVMDKHIAMFPIMAQWLPPEDSEQLVFQFEAELERLRRAA